MQWSHAFGLSMVLSFDQPSRVHEVLANVLREPELVSPVTHYKVCDLLCCKSNGAHWSPFSLNFSRGGKAMNRILRFKHIVLTIWDMV